MQLEFIYALEAEGTIFYCGRTDDLKRRYDEHLRDGDPEGTLKQRVIHQLLEEGIKITLKILEAGTAEQLYEKEECWRVNLSICFRLGIH